MKTKDIAEKINIYNVDIKYFYSPTPNVDYCSSSIIPSSVLAQIRGNASIASEETTFIGVNLLDCEHKELYNYFCHTNLPAVQKTCQTLQKNFHISQSHMALAYSLYAILHEIGHIVHLKEFELSYEDYWYRYNASRDNTNILFQFCYHKICHSDSERMILLAFVNEIYDNIPSEKAANKFAMQEFLRCWAIINNSNIK